MSTFSERLKEALSSSNKKGKDLAQAVGITASAVSHYLKGRNECNNLSIIKKMSEYLDVSAEWLYNGHGEKRKNNVLAIKTNDIPSSEFVQIMEYNVSLGAGDYPEPTYDELRDTLPATYRKDYFSSKGIDYRHCKRFKVVGDSMEPLINNGDVVLVDCTPTDTIQDNAIYAIIYSHSLRVKRIRKTLKEVIIHSDNPSYTDETLTLEEADQLITIIGKVIERSGTIQ